LSNYFDLLFLLPAAFVASGIGLLSVAQQLKEKGEPGDYGIATTSSQVCGALTLVAFVCLFVTIVAMKMLAMILR